MPGLPPPPTGVGAIPTGDPSSDPKEAADNAVLALRDLMGHFPSLKPTIDGAIDQIKSAAKNANKGPAPSAPPPPDDDPLSKSGTTGGF
jgi:hypothetical protein